MSNINTVALSGFLSGDPEVRWTGSGDDEGKSIVRLGVVVKRSVRQSDGSYEDSSSIFDVEVFGKFATLVAKKLRKLDSVAVQGKLEKDEWEKDGEKRSKVKVVATAIDSQGLYRSSDEDSSVAVSDASEPAAEKVESADDIPF